jgi:uncharacterized membrane protein required for colicin V production
MTSTLLDIVFLIIISSSAALGFVFGFIDSILSTLTFFGTLLIAFLIFPYTEAILDRHVQHEILLSIFTGIVSYILSVLLFYIMKSLIRKFTVKLSGGLLDKIFGMIFGLARGWVLFALSMLFLLSVSSTKSITREMIKNVEFTSEDKPEWFFDSYSFSFFANSFKGFNNLFPQIYDDIYNSISEKMNSIGSNDLTEDIEIFNEANKIEEENKNSKLDSKTKPSNKSQQPNESKKI